jgi:hypothetical protein
MNSIMNNPDYRAELQDLYTSIQLYTGLNPAAADVHPAELTRRLMDAMAAAAAALAHPEPVAPTDKTKEAMISALNTLEGWDNFDHWVWPVSALEQSKKNTTESLQMLRGALAKPEPPDDVEVAELVAWLRDRANSTSLAHTARRITRAADLLERLASDNAGLAAAADSLYTDNMSLLDSHHD